jgi:hypothetical protein
VAVRPARRAFLNAIWPLAGWSRARWFCDEVADAVVGVAAVEAQPLLALLAGLGSFDRDRVERRG